MWEKLTPLYTHEELRKTEQRGQNEYVKIYCTH